MPLPNLASIARQVLYDEPTFMALIAPERLGYRVPGDVTAPFVRVQCPNAAPRGGDSVLFRPLIQVDAYTAPGDDAEDTVWALAEAAGYTLGRVRNRTIGDVSFSGRRLDGPTPGYDTSRGESAPLVRCTVRVELTLHLR